MLPMGIENQKNNFGLSLVNKKIGVYLGCRPDGGGTFQYNLTILNALEDLKLRHGFHVVAFISNKLWFEYVPNSFEIIYVEKSLFVRFFDSILRNLFKNAHLWRLIASKVDCTAQKINKSSCELVIYPSQDSMAYLSHKPAIATIHDLMHRYEPNFMEYSVKEIQNREKHYKLTCQYSSLVLVDSTLGQQHVIESYNTPKNKVKILPFLPPSYLLERAYSYVDVVKKYSLKKPYFFYPAQFWEHKNHIRLIRAFKRLIDENYNVYLVLAGSQKNNYQNVLDEISFLNLKQHVYILGYVANNELRSLYTNAIATVFVSLIGPTNIPPIESLVLNTPLICSNVYAMPEQVGDAALLVDPKSEIDIMEKMKIIIDNPSLSSLLVKKGKEKISAYTKKDFCFLIESYLSEVLS
jgi:glycosyltransferase involved in cell wall biosynthesis